jgi:hypothetical protein
MKKIFLTLFLLVAFVMPVVSPVVAQAQTSNQCSAIVVSVQQILTQVIAMLQAGTITSQMAQPMLQQLTNMLAICTFMPGPTVDPIGVIIPELNYEFPITPGQEVTINNIRVKLNSLAQAQGLLSFDLTWLGNSDHPDATITRSVSIGANLAYGGYTVKVLAADNQQAVIKVTETRAAKGVIFDLTADHNRVPIGNTSIDVQLAAWGSNTVDLKLWWLNNATPHTRTVDALQTSTSTLLYGGYKLDMRRLPNNQLRTIVTEVTSPPASTISVTRPVTNQTLFRDESFRFDWQVGGASLPTTGEFRFYLRDSNGNPLSSYNTHITTATSTQRSKVYPVPSGLALGNYRIHVSYVNGGVVIASTTSHVFAVANRPASISVVSPTPASTGADIIPPLASGANINISWRDTSSSTRSLYHLILRKPGVSGYQATIHHGTFPRTSSTMSWAWNGSSYYEISGATATPAILSAGDYMIYVCPGEPNSANTCAASEVWIRVPATSASGQYGLIANTLQAIDNILSRLRALR